MDKRQAFTLIELLVVIAVIAILAALLFPVFARARERSRSTACMGNVKQIGLGISLYMDQWDETYPISEHVPPDRPHAWVEQLYRYAGTRGIGRCPSDGGYELDAFHRTSYLMNIYFDGGVAASDIPEPAQTVYMGEANDTTNADHYHPNQGVAVMGEELTRTRHLGGANYLFADAHARWSRFEQTLEPVNLHEIDPTRRRSTP